jgi:hypothetical protein
MFIFFIHAIPTTAGPSLLAIDAAVVSVICCNWRPGNFHAATIADDRFCLFKHFDLLFCTSKVRINDTKMPQINVSGMGWVLYALTSQSDDASTKLHI